MLSIALAALLSCQSLEDAERTLHEQRTAHRAARPAQAGPAFDAWDRKHLDLEWEYLTTLCRLADLRQDPKTWALVIQECTDFIWTREDYLAALQARILVARAHQALQQWGPCFAALAAARGDAKKNPDLLETTTQSLTVEFRARAAHGPDIERTLREADLHLKRFPDRRDQEPFLALRLERARALHALRRSAESETALRELLAGREETDFGRAVLETLTSLFRRTEDRLRLAGLFFDRHHYTEAARLYAQAPRSPEVWLRLGRCYVAMRRPYEAAEALRQACASPTAVRLEAATRLERVLNHLAAGLKDEAALPALRDHRAWMKRTLDLERAGPDVIRLLAALEASEGRFREALDLYAKIPPGGPGYEETLRSRAFCHYRLREFAPAAERCRDLLTRDRRTPDDAEAALDLGSRALLALGRPEEVLALTEQSAGASEWPLAHRVDAFSRLGRFDDARRTLASMKSPAASQVAIHALETLAAGYEREIRKGNRTLWGSYARAVVALSERTFRPLAGEKLLAAADALSIEATPESFGMAYDLYAQYLLDPALLPGTKDDVEYRQAQAAAGAGKVARALEIADALAARSPQNGSRRELQGDLQALSAQGMQPGAERNALLDRAIATYAELSHALQGRQPEHYWRLLFKYAAQSFARDPERAGQFFEIMEKRGHAAWDEGRWGYRERFDALKAKVTAALPRRTSR